jgi:PPM family protein phosphatase
MVVPDWEPGLQWRAAGLTDRGRKRRRNEDALLIAPDLSVCAVADGMGGHAAGDVASRIGIEVLAAAFGVPAADTRAYPVRAAAIPRASPPAVPAGELVRRLTASFDAANAQMLDHAVRNRECAGMGSTMTALAPAADGQVVIAHIGDSRAYLVRNGELLRLTRDHTWVQQQVDAGILTPEQARHHARSSLLTRVLGIAAAEPVDATVADAEAGDVFLLCSDGLTNMLGDAEIRAVLDACEPADAPARLVALANQRGGLDNITVVVCAAERARADS